MDRAMRVFDAVARLRAGLHDLFWVAATVVTTYRTKGSHS